MTRPISNKTLQPPGTGKTKTIIQTVNLLKRHFGVAHPILVCTYTNVAVDNLVEGFAATGAKPVRVAFGGQVKGSLQEHTLDYKIDRHRLKPSLDKLTEEERTLRTDIQELEKLIFQTAKKAKKGGPLQVRLSRMRVAMNVKTRTFNVTRSKIYGMRQTMLREILGQADVVSGVVIYLITSC